MLRIDSCTLCSLSASKAEVASSKMSILGLLINALAIDILYFCPPDNFSPLSPTMVLNLLIINNKKPFRKLLAIHDKV